MIFPPTILLKTLSYMLMNAKIELLGHNHTSWAEKTALQRRGIERGGGFADEDKEQYDNLERVSQDNYPRIFNLTKEIADQLNQPMPALYAYDGVHKPSGSPGCARSLDYSMLLSRQFCEDLTDDELKSLIGHEFSHFFDNGIKLKATAVVANAIEAPAALASSTLGKATAAAALAGISIQKLSENGFDISKAYSDLNDSAPNPALSATVAVTWITSVLIAQMMHFKAAQEHEYDADALGAKFSGVDAAVTLEGKVESFVDSNESQKKPSFLKKILSEKVPKPVKSFVQDMLHTHPTAENRVKAVQQGTYTDRALKRFDEPLENQGKASPYTF